MWRVLRERLITKIEIYLVKEKVGRGGSLEKTLRSTIALALVKFSKDCPDQLLLEGHQLRVRSTALYSIVLALYERNAGSGYLSAKDP